MLIKEAFNWGEAAMIGLPTMAGAGYGAYKGDDENMLRNALLGGLAGSLMGTGAVAGKRYLSKQLPSGVTNVRVDPKATIQEMIDTLPPDKKAIILDAVKLEPNMPAKEIAELINNVKGAGDPAAFSRIAAGAS